MRVDVDGQEATPASTETPASNTDSPVSSLDDCGVRASDEIPTPERALLAKLEEENRRIEADAKSLASLTHVHSRKSSDTSQISLASATSSNYDEARVGNGEEDLWSLWGRLVSNWETEWRRRNQFVRDLVRQGVPHHFRGIVWQLLAGVDASPDKKLYASYIKAKSACEKVIRRDIARTYPEHDFFKEKDGLGQESLFNVMKAYSLHDREVGYCQGSGFIVGLLLMQMPEEEAFAVLVKIMQQHRMRDMFKPSMAELGLCMFQLENLVQELLPDLHVHFQSQSFSTSIYASSWFLTLFTTTLSLPLACRIMDVFLSEGIEIVFKVALAMLTLGKNDLLSLDMESILKYIQKELPLKAEADQDGFMNLAYSIKVNPKKMKKLEKEYTVIKTKEQGDIAVLRCLRQENRLLKQRVELLEKESSALAERLVQGQVDRAEGEEETFALAREVQALRRANVDAQQRLAVAQDEIRSLEMTIAENNSRQSSLEGTENSAKGEELARCLQRELVRARLHAAEREAAERELTARIAELENENKILRKQRVDNNVAHLQVSDAAASELDRARLHAAEREAAEKELTARIAELENENKILRKQRVDNNVAHLQVSDAAASELDRARLHAAEREAAEKELTARIAELENENKILRKQRVDNNVAHLQVSDAAASELDRARLHAAEREAAEKELTARIAELENENKILRKQRVDNNVAHLQVSDAAASELDRARLHAAEREAAEKELTARIAELENENKILRKQRVDNNVAHLQDELIAVKLREAEANLSLKDLRQRVTELSESWQRHLAEHRQEPTPPPAQSTVVSDIMATPKKLLRAWEGRSGDIQKLDEELMTTRIREVEALTELKELRLKEMELRTQVQVSTNQLRRQDEELRELREALDAALQRERALQARQREFQHKYTDLESKAKYESMQANIKNMEDAQRIAELEAEVSEYKLKNEVMATEGELRSNNVDDSDRVREMQELVAELKADVMRLEARHARTLGRKLTHAVSVGEDLEEVIDDKLRLILRRESSASLDLNRKNSTTSLDSRKNS